MRVLVACEESQRVCTAFRGKGHEAYSADLLECSGGHPEWHIQGYVLPLLNGCVKFTTCDGTTHKIDGKWDLLIAHPPCTYLTSSSSVRLFTHDHQIADYDRLRKGIQASIFFHRILLADCEKIAIENPTPIKLFCLPPYSQIIEPFYFGDPYRKRTCLWLKNLPNLEKTCVVEPQGLWVGSTSGRRKGKIFSTYTLRSVRDPRERSKTFHGIAKAMAEQWGCK